MSRLPGTGQCLLVVIVSLTGIGLPTQAARHDTEPHARATTARASAARDSGTGDERSQRRPHPTARYTSARTHRPPSASPATVWRAGRRPHLAMVVCARPVSGHGAPPRTGVESRTTPGRCGQRSNTRHNASRLASRVCRRHTTGRRSRVPVHRDRPRRPYTHGASKRARVSRAAWRPGSRGGPPLAPARAGGLDARGTRTMTGGRADPSFTPASAPGETTGRSRPDR